MGMYYNPKGLFTCDDFNALMATGRPYNLLTFTEYRSPPSVLEGFRVRISRHPESPLKGCSAAGWRVDDENYEVEEIGRHFIESSEIFQDQCSYINLVCLKVIHRKSRAFFKFFVTYGNQHNFTFDFSHAIQQHIDPGDIYVIAQDCNPYALRDGGTHNSTTNKAFEPILGNLELFMHRTGGVQQLNRFNGVNHLTDTLLANCLVIPLKCQQLEDHYIGGDMGKLKEAVHFPYEFIVCFEHPPFPKPERFSWRPSVKKSDK